MTIDRTQREQELATALAAALLRLRTSIESGVPNYYQFTAEAGAALRDGLAATYRDAANDLTATHGDGSSANVEAQASQYAASVADSIAQAMADNTAAALGGVAIVGGSLVGSHLFSAERAAATAITETTRAISQGQQAAAGLIALATRSRLTVRWKTEGDDKVCPICSPLDGKTENEPEGYGREFPGGPPAHPYCRCELAFQFEPVLSPVGGGI